MSQLKKVKRCLFIGMLVMVFLHDHFTKHCETWTLLWRLQQERRNLVACQHLRCSALIRHQLVCSGPAQTIPAPQARSIFSAPSQLMTSSFSINRGTICLNVNKHNLYILILPVRPGQGQFQHPSTQKNFYGRYFYIKLSYSMHAEFILLRKSLVVG